MERVAVEADRHRVGDRLRRRLGTDNTTLSSSQRGIPPEAVD
jgi:hypothetical protein